MQGRDILPVSAVANDIITGSLQIGFPLEGEFGDSLVSMTSGSIKHLSKQIGPAGLV